MVTHKDDMFGSFQHGQQTLRLDSLCGFIDENVMEFQSLETVIS
jgi:hypothetical protein